MSNMSDDSRAFQRSRKVVEGFNYASIFTIEDLNLG